jgi:hypothetical protein
MGSAGCHGRGSLPVALRQKLATPRSWLQERNSQRLVRTHKVIVSPPPFQVGQQVWGLLRRGPGPPRERCHAVTDGQIQPLNESGVESAREA